MKNTYYTLIFLIYSSFCLSQTINNPLYFSKSHEYLNIEKIDILSNKTILFFSYTNPFDKDGWVRISKDSYLKDDFNNLTYKLISAKDIGVYPNKTTFSSKGQKINFSLEFEKLNEKTFCFDFAECKEKGCFWISGINSNPNNKQNISDFELNYLKNLFASNSYENLFVSSMYFKKNRAKSDKLDLYLGIAYGYKKDFELAEKYLSNYLSNFPEDEDVYSLLGHYYVNLGKYNEALTFLERGILNGDEYCYYLSGYCHFKLNQIDLALSDYDKYSKYKSSENNHEFYSYYSGSQFEKGNTIGDSDFLQSKAYFNSAIINIKKAINLAPSNYEYLGTLGLYYMLLNDYENSLIYYNKSLKLNPEQIELKEYISTINKLININKIKLKKENDVFLIPATLNNSITVDFIFDSGASEVLVSPEIVGLLLKRNLINKSDILEDGYFEIADGTIIKLKRFIIRDFKIGNKNLKNINCTVANELYTDMLLGQSVLSKLGKYTFDYKNLILEIN